MAHYLSSEGCNTDSVNFTQKWQEKNCNTFQTKKIQFFLHILKTTSKINTTLQDSFFNQSKNRCDAQKQIALNVLEACRQRALKFFLLYPTSTQSSQFKKKSIYSLPFLYQGFFLCLLFLYHPTTHTHIQQNCHHVF